MKRNDKNRMTWYNVSLKQYKELLEALKIEDSEEQAIEVTRVLLGEEVLDLPVQEFFAKMSEFGFLKEEIPVSNPPKHLKVNGREYKMDCLLGNISTAQYIDFQNHAKTGDMAKMLSVFIIPEKHEYNDGYDMLQVFADINDLPIPIVNSAAFFFSRQLAKFIQIFQSYSIKNIKKMKIPKEQKEQMIKAITSSVDLAFSLLSSNSAK